MVKRALPAKPAPRSRLTSGDVQSVVEAYTGLHDERGGGDVHRRRERYASLVNHYYDLVTDFYERGWGPCFHFAPGRRGESFESALRRHELFLAERLALAPGMEVLDVGCGVGGPMCALVRHSGASFVGLNNNAYQLERAREHTRDLEPPCRFILGDFMRIPEREARYDAAIAIESTAHAPDKQAAFAEIRRVLRPGAGFAGYEWCLTERYDADDAEHRRIKKAIEAGSGLPDIVTTAQVCRALSAAGFELVEARDLAPEASPQSPWYRPLQGRELTLRSLPRSPMGRALTNWTLLGLETLRLVPGGTRAVSTFLNRTADALVAGGEAGIFTPMLYFLARSPARPDGA